MLFQHPKLGRLEARERGLSLEFKKADVLRMLWGAAPMDSEEFISRDKVYQLIESAPDGRRKDYFCLWFSSRVERKQLSRLYFRSLRKRLFPTVKPLSYFEFMIKRKRSVSLSELRKDYAISEKLLTKLLFETEVLSKLGEGYVPDLKMLAFGYLELDPSPKHSFLITPAGQIHIYTELKARGVTPILERQVSSC